MNYSNFLAAFDLFLMKRTNYSAQGPRIQSCCGDLPDRRDILSTVNVYEDSQACVSDVEMWMTGWACEGPYPLSI